MNRPILGTALTITGIHTKTRRVRENKKADYRYTYKAVCACGRETLVPESKLYGVKKRISCGHHTHEELKTLPRHTEVKTSFTRPTEEQIREARDFGGLATEHILRSTWSGMLDRCTNERSPHYKGYGGRGICVDELWAENFWAFVATVGTRPTGASLGRIDNDGPYSPENCRWETAEVQAQNRRNTRMLTHQNQTRSVADWARLLGVPVADINAALRLGIPASVILNSIKARNT